MSRLVSRWVREEEGQDIVEYALLVATISLMILTGVQSFGAQIEAIYTDLYNAVSALL